MNTIARQLRDALLALISQHDEGLISDYEYACGVCDAGTLAVALEQAQTTTLAIDDASGAIVLH